MLQQWNLSVQKQFGSSWALTASYIGNHNVHLLIDQEGSPGIYSAGATTSNTQARRFLTTLNSTQGPYYAALALLQDNGTETYNGGVLSLQKRFSNNYSAVVNYTYGHCIDTGEPSTTFVSSAWRGPLNSLVGNCSWDHRHQLTINGSIHSPQFHSKWAQVILGNWQMAPIASYLSGDWLTITTGADCWVSNLVSALASGQTDKRIVSHIPDWRPSYKIRRSRPIRRRRESAGSIPLPSPRQQPVLDSLETWSTLAMVR